MVEWTKFGNAIREAKSQVIENPNKICLDQFVTTKTIHKHVMFVCLFVCLFVWLVGWLVGWLFVCLFVCVFVCLFF